MTEHQVLPEEIANNQRLLRIHISLTSEELREYFAMRSACRELPAGSEAQRALVGNFTQRFSDFVADWKTFGVTQYPTPLLPSLPYNYFATIDREHASGAVLFLLANPSPQSRAIYAHWATWRAMLAAVGLGSLHDDLCQWSSYLQVMRKVCSQKTFPRQTLWAELIPQLVMRRDLVDGRVTGVVAYVARCIRDCLGLDRNSDRLIISDTGLVVDGPALTIERRLP
ncbi:hypothetical protein O152_gp162 [Pseudomonas phage PaBG]|uniref:Uncharacterized protein n=1 Tax=Pseudomonas phage PaBG TaxID=1335230 RepID=S5VMC5_9CAUD|nr:hypothetical protein O152_gp162 [Pseudomonas phage PaBG]AGS82044.1 hypothetical protein PaBG_00162 [Pseudomonas phage PaBG]